MRDLGRSDGRIERQWNVKVRKLKWRRSTTRAAPELVGPSALEDLERLEGLCRGISLAEITATSGVREDLETIYDHGCDFAHPG
jgi:hypothetical protein